MKHLATTLIPLILLGAYAHADVELKDEERVAAFHRIAFHRPDGGTVEIETTRPELLPACVALVAHPDDERSFRDEL